MRKFLLTLLMVAVVAPSIYACGCGCERKTGDSKECGMPHCDGLKLKECKQEEKAPVVKKEKKTKRVKKAKKSCCKKAKTCCGKKKTKEAKTVEK